MPPVGGEQQTLLTGPAPIPSAAQSRAPNQVMKDRGSKYCDNHEDDEEEVDEDDELDDDPTRADGQGERVYSGYRLSL